MALTKAQTESLRTLARELDQARRGEKRALVEERAHSLGLSVQTVYRALAEMCETAGSKGQRKKRADAGQRCVDRELAIRVAGLVPTAPRADGQKTLTLEAAP